ncbi:MAG: LysR family transcriptional regulator [Solirubrobacteraceae bacterium]|nr:LysR family transcriptional regulator [Solirubrobacteraceae bacterium]
MLNVSRLRVLREVATRGSFSAAAEELAYTQSAVSQQIATLEKEVGARLLERSPRGVTLTEPGRVLLGHAEVILGRLAEAEAELDALTGLRAGRLRLTTFATAGATIMPRAIRAFRERYPEIELTLDPAEPPEVRAALRAGEADICVTIDAADEPFDDTGEFELEHLLDDPMLILLPTEHRLAQVDGPVDLRDLADERWILGSGDTCPDPRMHLRACQKAGFEPNVSYQTDDYMAVQGFVASGWGVAFVPDMALVTARDDVVARSLVGGAPVRRIHAAMVAGTWESPSRRAMLDILREVGAGWEAERGAVEAARV